MRAFKFLPLLLLMCGTAAFADCDAEFVKALRSNYSETTGGTLKDELFELVCTKAVQSKSTDASGNAIGYGDASYGEDSMTVNEACAKRDKTYFEKNSKHIVYSLLPPHVIEVLKGCFPGSVRGLSLAAVENANEVIVTAMWEDPTNGQNPLATVRNFRASGAVCDSQDFFAPNTKLGKISMSCSLTSGSGGASFILNTDMGSAFATVGPSLLSNKARRGVINVVMFNVMQTDSGYLFQPNITSRYQIPIPKSMDELVSVIGWHCVGNCEAMNQFSQVSVSKATRQSVELSATGKDGAATVGIAIDVEYRDAAN